MVKPLTKIHTTGKVLQRPTKVEQEIADALDLTPAEVQDRAQIDKQDKLSLSSECLVYFIRRALENTEQEFLGSLFDILLKRCTASLKKTVAGVPNHLRDEVIDTILLRLMEELLGRTDKADFLEVKFNLAFSRLRFDAIRRWRQDAAYHYISDPDDKNEELPMHESQTVLDSEERSLLALDDILLRMKALSVLTREEYNIVSLHYWLDIPITSLESGATSLTKLTGLSERTIRTRLQEAKAKLKTIMKEEPPHANDAPHHNGP